MEKIVEMISRERVKILESSDKDAALLEMIDLLATSDNITNRDELEHMIYERENILSTSIGLGIAIPHVRLDSVKEMTIAVGVCRKGINYRSFDDNPVFLIIMIASPTGTHRQYLSVLAKIALLLKNETLRNNLNNAVDENEIYSLLKGQ